MNFISRITVLVTLALVVSASAFAQKKVAVVTFFADKHIDFSELGGGAALVAAIGSLSEDENFNLQPVLNNFHETFFGSYAEQFPFELMPEKDVLGNPAYQAYESKHGETSDEDRNKLFQRYLTYEGYKPMGATLLKKNSNEAAMLEIFNEVDGVMLVNIEYAFVKKAVPFTAGVRAYVTMKLYNKEGKKVFAIRQHANSKKSVAIVGGIPIMKPATLLPLCEAATAEVIEDLNKKLKKVAAKSAKKL
jgi:hypothetical protein